MGVRHDYAVQFACAMLGNGEISKDILEQAAEAERDPRDVLLDAAFDLADQVLRRETHDGTQASPTRSDKSSDKLGDRATERSRKTRFLRRGRR